MIPNDFHFERPLWLLAAIPAALVLWSAARAGVRTSAWRNAVDAHLLRHLLLPGDTQKSSSWLWLLGLGWLAAILAMAGPSWERVPQPTTKTIEPTVVALEMSPSMDSTDLTPSRLARARYKLQDVLQRSAGGQVALVIYSDEPFVVSPLTDDARVIQEMIPTLESSLMPGHGNRADRAIDQSLALLEQAGVPGGRILLLADSPGDNPELTRRAAARAAAQGRELSVLGVGTEEGAPVRGAMTSHIVPSELEALAAAGGGRFALVTPSGADLDDLLALPRSAASQTSDSSVSADVEVWRDAGIYLLFIPVLLAPLAFRRGWLAVVALAVLLGGSNDAEASFWQDLWQTRDQQAAAAFQSGDAAQAAELFESPDWKAAAHYQSGQYDQAIGAYGALDGSENRYNQGNALAKAGKLEEAIQAYDEVLEKQDDHDDARFNRDLVKKLLEEQKQQQQQQNQDQQGGEGEQQDQQQSGSEGSQNQQESQQGQQEQASENQSGKGEKSQENQSAEQQGAQGSEQAQSEEQKQEGQQASAQEPSADAKKQDQASAGSEDGSQEREEQQAKAQQAKAPDKQDDSLSEQLSKALEAQEQAEPANGEKDEQGTQVSGSSKKPITEEQQAREQKLRQIPDDPGGLLRAKIHRRYAEKRYSQGGASPW